MVGTRDMKPLAVAAILLFVSVGSASSITVDVVSASGSDIDDFDLSVTGEGISISRSGIDSFDRNFQEGDYDFTIRKQGYQSIERSIEVQEEVDATYTFSMGETEDKNDSTIDITRIYSPERVCKGESFSVDFDIENTGDTGQVVSTTGYGFGKILLGKSFVVNSGQTRTYRFIFTSVRGSGSKEFRVSASGADSDSVTGEILVDDCVAPGSAAAVENIETNVYPVGGRTKAFKGEVVRVKGFADGARGSVDLNLSINGEKIGTVRTQRDGYFQTYIRPESSGRKTISVSSPGVSGSADLEVAPNPEVSEIEAPDEVFSGENFDICVDVSSSITPEVVLTENGGVIESRQARDSVCFRVQAPEPGEYNYSIRTLTRGQDSSSSKEIDVLEQGPEAGSFPGQVTSVETEDGLVKVELYNTNNNSRNYTVSLEGLSREWISAPVKNISLNRGDRETVYFYISPGTEGRFDSTVRVISGETEIYSDTVEVFSTGAHREEELDVNIYRVILLTLNVVL